MLKWKIITVCLVVLCIILCMMTIYMQREYHFAQMVAQRTETENYLLKKDYEKLYEAYYSYDKKILKILDGNKNVFWAKDSSAYMVKNENEFLFSFYKKPKMEVECFIWWVMWVHDKNGSSYYSYTQSARVDTLKPHQFCFIKGDYNEMHSIIVGSEGFDKKPLAKDEVLNILLKH